MEPGNILLIFGGGMSLLIVLLLPLNKRALMQHGPLPQGPGQGPSAKSALMLLFKLAVLMIIAGLVWNHFLR